VEFLTGQGLARPNPRAAFDRWLPARLAVLPAPFAAEVRTWAEALQGRGPRAGPVWQSSTIQGYLRILQAPLASWSARYESLRQVNTDDLAAQLAPLTGATRLLALSGDAVAVRHAQGPPGAVHQPGRAADQPQNPAPAGAAGG
jgi:hypothetical protein